MHSDKRPAPRLRSAMILIAFLIAAAPSDVAGSIDKYCQSEPGCVAEQRTSLRYFLNLTVVSGATEADSERCMRSAKAGPAIDWVRAESCIRAVAKRRKAIAPLFEERG